MPGQERTTILFVTIDRPEDAYPVWHQPNADGVQRAAATVDPSLAVVRTTIDELAGMDADALDAKWNPLAIFGAGSFSEWFNYGTDDAWRAKLESYMAIVRATEIPMLAVCGSHQLVSAAFNGWSAIGHMNDGGDPVTIASELALDPPAPMFPSPRVGEEGTYPIVSVADDPLMSLVGANGMGAVHHKDMVVDTTGFILLCTGDDSRPAASSAPNQAQTRCRVHALRRDDDSRILYTTQFHPEMARFDESTQDDGGLGQTLIAAFSRQAQTWWTS
jgi:hypothetical protein